MDISSLTPDKQVKFQYWLNVIHECRASGLTNQDWCEKNNISLKSYYYWIAKFRKLALEELPRKEYSSPLPAVADRSCQDAQPFVEIPALSSNSCPVNPSSPAAVLKTGGITIEIYNNASEAFMRMLLKELHKC